MNEKEMLHLANDERGAGLFEYALLVSLVAVVMIAAVTFVGVRTKGTFLDIADGVASKNNLPSKPSFP